MGKENFGLCSFWLARNGVPMAELLSEKHIKTDNVNFRIAKRL